VAVFRKCQEGEDKGCADLWRPGVGSCTAWPCTHPTVQSEPKDVPKDGPDSRMMNGTTPLDNKSGPGRALVAHASNPRDQEDYSSKPAQANSL
jgi:hypothetical protein